ncbi:MAG: nucleotidyltransferase [Lachnospiraceae bacterium]|nr:nucleotidyltransferase [Lachnospiraceae bacterium]
MKVAGIIVEYNPFHKGHEYHIAETRRVTGADFVIAVMSGDFTQRGIPACFDKFTRAECALAGGADVVLELPFCYATGSAEYFATGAVSILDKLGCVDSLCFGTETTADISLYLDTAAFLCNEPPAFQAALKEGLKEGKTFPKARLDAAKGFLNEDALALLATPNALLGLEYCKALYRRNSNIKPYTIARVGAGYHDETASPDSFSSATALRALLSKEGCFSDAFLSELPVATADILRTKAYTPLFSEDFLLLYRTALDLKKNELASFADVSEELAARLSSRIAPCNYEAFLEHMKTKQYTRTRIERCLLHVLFDVKAEALERFRLEDVSYARILGFRESAAPLLKHTKKTAALPLLTKLAQKEKRCTAAENELLSYDIAAADVYNWVAFQKYGVLLGDEFSYIITNA